MQTQAPKARETPEPRVGRCQVGAVSVPTAPRTEGRPPTWACATSPHVNKTILNT